MSKKERIRLYEFDESRLHGLRKLAVVGDIHGDNFVLHSLLKMIDPKKDGIIFLGDYADRGLNGLDVIATIDSLIKKYPNNVVALKGNHEDFSVNGEPKFQPCDLIREVESKGKNWDRYFQEELKPFIENLYLAAIIPNETLLVHGGISSRIESLASLKYPTRSIEIDLLWSDPFDGDGELPNIRGAGTIFGRDITEKVCDSLKIKRIIRSHEPMKAISGPHYEHDRRIMTISSTSAYGGKPFMLIIDSKVPSNISTNFL